jgi:hypothetical protein
MALDADIAQAATALDLEKIRTQEYRDHVNAAQSQAAFVAAEGAKLLDPDAELRLKIVKALAANYMKPTTGTLPATIQTDTANDAERLRQAVAACVAIVKGQ